jgi:dolichol-phosphate mannosyltransferase
MPTALVCLPTYNEAENILPLIAAVRRSLPEAGVLVIDDRSPDGTGGLVREAAATDSRVFLLSRPGKLGLGTAYMAGFAYAIEHQFDCAITMDADFSHPPERLPALLAAVVSGAELAIGSRYVPGGGIEGWPLRRRILSAAANSFARTMLGLGAHDCTGGFRCYAHSTVEFLLGEPLRSSGYSALIELLTRCERAGLRIAEVPITFADRVAGASKISRAELRRAFFTVLQQTRLPLLYRPGNPSIRASAEPSIQAEVGALASLLVAAGSSPADEGHK